MAWRLRRRIVRLKAEGHTYKDIVLALGVSQTLVRSALRDAGLVETDRKADPRAPFGGALGVLDGRTRRHRSAADPGDACAWAAATYRDAARDRRSLLIKAGIRPWTSACDATQEALVAWAQRPDSEPTHYVALSRLIDSTVASCELPADVARRAIIQAATGEGGDDDAERIAREFIARPSIDLDDLDGGCDDRGKAAEDRDEVGRIVARLGRRQRFVLAARFGLIDGRERTLDEIAESLGVSCERVRQLLNKAMAKATEFATCLERRRDHERDARRPEPGWPFGPWEAGIPKDYGAEASACAT